MKQGKTKVLSVLAAIIIVLVVFVIVPALWFGGWNVGAAKIWAIYGLEVMGFSAVLGVVFAVVLDLLHRNLGD